MKRRDFLASAAGVPLLGLMGCSRKSQPLPPGLLLGPSMLRGHRLRESAAAARHTVTRKTGVLIIGGGVAGLSAAWALKRAGMKEFALLELEDEVGGNARSGRNEVSEYPLGAHYLPAPPATNLPLRILLKDLGVLLGEPADPQALFDPAMLCHAPQERLFHQRRWQPGLLPVEGQSPAVLAEYHHFQNQLTAIKTENKFPLPLGTATFTSQTSALDKISFQQWLDGQQLHAEPLRWFLNYCTRDEYGSSLSEVSAYAGLHYFLARNGFPYALDADSSANSPVLTWPGGNGWVTRALAGTLHEHLHTGRLIHNIQQDRKQVQVEVWNAQENTHERWQADQVIVATPLFVLKHLWPDMPAPIRAALPLWTYAPWLVANLTLHQPPREAIDQTMAWDNVIYQGKGLGYVVATHQALTLGQGPTVLTYYRTFENREPEATRQRMQTTGQPEWARAILDDLRIAHPDLPSLVKRLDVMCWPHAMVRPAVGLLGHPIRQRLQRRFERILLAHADLSGYSVFEEAFAQGWRAAHTILKG